MSDIYLIISSKIESIFDYYKLFSDTTRVKNVENLNILRGRICFHMFSYQTSFNKELGVSKFTFSLCLGNLSCVNKSRMTLNPLYFESPLLWIPFTLNTPYFETPLLWIPLTLNTPYFESPLLWIPLTLKPHDFETPLLWIPITLNHHYFESPLLWIPNY